VARTLLKHHPQCPIAFISGVFENDYIAAATAMGIGRCFEKSTSMEHIYNIHQFVQDADRKRIH
jgi:hypothetical protein